MGSGSGLGGPDGGFFSVVAAMAKPLLPTLKPPPGPPEPPKPLPEPTRGSPSRGLT